jgi:hypothetical protein
MLEHPQPTEPAAKRDGAPDEIDSPPPDIPVVPPPDIPPEPMPDEPAPHPGVPGPR